MSRSSIVLPFRVTAMSIYLVFSVDQQLRADEERGVGHLSFYFVFLGKRKKESIFLFAFLETRRKGKRNCVSNIGLIFSEKGKGILPGEFEFLFPPRAEDY